MRISGGAARGARLKAAPGSRPTSERVRQAIFSSLASSVDGARVLDLYCGSGAYGLEALSRGASSCVFVDRDARAIAAARANAEVSRAARAIFHGRDAGRYLHTEAAREGPFDLVFCDPPYDGPPGLEALLDGLTVAVRNQGRVVVEMRATAVAPPDVEGYVLEADRRYGDTRVLVFRRSAGQSRGKPRPTEDPMTIGCCPGSFDPVTNGHVDLFRRATDMFDLVYVAVLENPAKKPMFTTDERMEMIRSATAGLDNIKVVSFQGLTVDFCKQVGANAIVKGLRGGKDFDYELQQAQMNARMGVETAFLAANPAISYVSATLMKEIVGFGGSIEGLVPPEVAERLVERLREGR